MRCCSDCCKDLRPRRPRAGHEQWRIRRAARPITCGIAKSLVAQSLRPGLRPHPDHFGVDVPVRMQRQRPVGRRRVVDGEVVRQRPELRAGGWRGQYAHAIHHYVQRLVHMAEQHGAHVCMALQRCEEGVGIGQAHRVQPAAAHGHRDDGAGRPARGDRGACASSRSSCCSEASLSAPPVWPAMVLSSSSTRQLPRSNTPSSWKGSPVQRRAHGRHVIVVAGQAQDGLAQRGEFRAEVRVSARIVLDQVAGGENGLAGGDVARARQPASRAGRAGWARRAARPSGSANRC